MTNPHRPVGAPCWIDIGTTDVPGAIDFYTQLFGWTHFDFGPDSGGYGAFLQHGKQVAGIGPATDPARGTSWTTYLKVDDVNATDAKVEAAGGKVIVPAMDVMGQGRMAVYTDSAGAFISVWEPGEHPGAELFDEHGSLSWAELMTGDIEGAKAFYGSVFGLSTRDADAGDGGIYVLMEVDGRPVTGAMQFRPDWGPMPPHWSIYFEVNDADAIADKAVELGATELMRLDSPAGRFATLTDPQGGTFSVIKGDPEYNM